MFDSFVNSPRRKIPVLFGTRPETVKLALVIYELKKNFQTIVALSSQHKDLLQPALKIFNVKTDYDLRLMTTNQTPNQIIAIVLTALDAILELEKPEIILVQLVRQHAG